MPPKKRRKPGPIPLAVRLAASNDLEDAEPWHQNMTPSFSEEVPTPSLTEVPAPSLAKERAPSLAKVRAPSSAEVLAPSLAKVRAPSLAKVPAPSSAEVLAPSLAKVRAPSSAEVLAPSLAKVRAPSLAKVRAPSSAEVRASSLAKERAPSSASHAEGPGSQEMNQLIGRIIRYLLSANRSKNVIQRPQLIKSAFGNYGKHYRLVMPIVKRKLSQTFGLRLIEFETSKYILVNAIENGKFHLQVPEDEKPCRMLLILILTHIFMLDGKSSEDSIWRFLRCLKIIEEDDFNSEYFGDVQKVVCTDFVNQMYLSRSMIGSTEPPKYELQWGLRAKLEVSKRHMLDFVSKMYGDRSLSSWPNQYKSMLADERTDA